MPAVGPWSAVGYDIQTGDPAKLGLVCGDQRQPVAHARRRDPEVLGTDQSALLPECTYDPPVGEGGGSVYGQQMVLLANGTQQRILRVGETLGEFAKRGG